MQRTSGSQSWTVGEQARPGIAGPVVGSMRYASSSGSWQPTEFKGFWMKPLYEDAATGEKTLLMKIDPGAYAPMHTHPDEMEQICVLEGAMYDQEGTLISGDYCCRAPGADHEAGSLEGAIVLVVYSRR